MKFISEDLENYASEHTQSEGDLLLRLKAETYAQLEIPQMLSGRLVGRFLKLLALLVGARRIVEVGMFGGYSALSMAEALPEDGEVVTCESDPEAIAFARRFYAASPHGKKVTVKEGPALDTLRQLNGPFDMAFIDADKVNYSRYYDAIFPMLRSGGVIVADNVLWSGRVLNPEDETDRAICAFNDKIMADARVDQVMLPVRDGLYCVRKK